MHCHDLSCIPCLDLSCPTLSCPALLCPVCSILPCPALSSLLTSSGRQARSKAEVEQRTELGLVKGHAYGITAIKKVPIGNTTLVNFFT